MPPQDPQSDKEFMSATPADQMRYLQQTDPDFAKASSADQAAYLAHVTNQPMQEPPPGDQFDQDRATTENWAKGHPIAGPIARFMVNAGQNAANAITKTPGQMYHALADPSTVEESGLSIPQRFVSRMGGKDAIQAASDYAGGKVSPSAAASVLPEALGAGVGQVAGGAVYGKMGEAVPTMANAMGEIPPGRVMRTAGKVVGNVMADTPILRKVTPRAIMKAYGEAGPPDIGTLTKEAIKERTASQIPTRMRPTMSRSTNLQSADVAPTEGGVMGSLAKGKGRMVLTPEEIAQSEQLYKIAQRNARERGMAFAGGQVPSGGRKVPMNPLPNLTEDWRGLKPLE